MESARCKAFIESVERGSFRAAAEALGYTPSAVSQLVAALEKDLGLMLLVRSKKGVKVTSEGAKLAPIVRTYCYCFVAALIVECSCRQAHFALYTGG